MEIILGVEGVTAFVKETGMKGGVDSRVGVKDARVATTGSGCGYGLFASESIRAGNGCLLLKS